MNEHSHARSAAALLSRARREEEAPEPPDAASRARAIAAVEQAIAARARAKKRLRVGVGIAAAAAVALAVGTTALAVRGGPEPVAMQVQRAPMPQIGAVVHPQGDVDVLASDGESPATDGETIGRGNRLVVRPQGRATLAFASGTQLTLEERGDLTIEGDGAQQRFALGGGSVSAHVAKLGPGQRFVVSTGDAEVEVRGTTFRVSVVPAEAACADGTRTRVDVTEGVVVVRHAGVEARVGPGEHWPSSCERASAAPSATIAEASAKKPPPAPSAASHLGDQNDLFAQALAAKRRGDAGTAIALFDRYLAQYPSSPLAESAMAERMRMVHTRAAAQQYLARYPNGFARADAQAISNP